MDRVTRYLRAVKRRLRLPADLRDRLLSDLLTSINARREQGESDEAILASLGTPKQAAEELNEQMKEYTFRKSPWRWPFFALAALCLLSLLWNVLLTQLLSGNNAMGIIGGADGPTAIFVTTVTGGFPWDILLRAVLALLGIYGYLRLSHCRRS